jgi:integrase
MSKTTKPLTNTEISQAKPREKEYNLADGHGLLLRVKPTGSKLWLFNYTRPYSKKRANLGLGRYPEVTLADARKKREEARRLLSEQIDPQEFRDSEYQKATATTECTLEKVASNWFSVKQSQVTHDYAEDIWRSLELHVFPTLGKLPITDIKATIAIETLKPIAARGSLETVKRLTQRLNEIMTFAVNTGVLEANSLSGIGNAFQTPKKKHMPTLRPEELPALMRNIGTASIKTTTKALLEWQLHTMTRPSEAAGTLWEEIDFEKKIWHIPAARMKKKRDHKIPLSKQAIELLEFMRPISGHRKHVFPADRNPKTHINSQSGNVALSRMGYGGRLVSHGLRALASTTLNEHGFDFDLIEKALAHVDGNEVRAAYNRAEYLERRREMMNWWSERIEQSASSSMLSRA